MFLYQFFYYPLIAFCDILETHFGRIWHAQDKFIFIAFPSNIEWCCTFSCFWCAYDLKYCYCFGCWLLNASKDFFNFVQLVKEERFFIWRFCYGYLLLNFFSVVIAFPYNSKSPLFLSVIYKRNVIQKILTEDLFMITVTWI